MLGKLFCLILIFSFAFLFGVLYSTNRKRALRYSHIYIPPAAIGFFLIILYLFANYYIPFKHLVQSYVADNLKGDTLNIKIDIFFDLIFALLVFAVYIVFKLAVPKTISFLTRKVRLAYYWDLGDAKAYLRDEWVFARHFSLLLMCFAFVIFLLSFFALYYNKTFVPLFGLFSLIAALEFFWYLNGYIKKQVHIDSISGEDSTSGFLAEYRNLWKEYMEVWKDKLITAWSFNRRTTASVTHVEQLSEPLLQIINAKGKNISEREHDLFSKLESNVDILIEKNNYEGIDLILFASLYNKLNRGENILFLIDESFKANEKESESFKVARWISCKLSFITGMQDFVTPHLYNPSGINTGISQMIISSPGDLLNSRFYEDKWFDDVHTIVVININNYFNGEIASLNILSKLINFNHQHIQYIVLADFYREALEPSARSIIDVSNNLNEIKFTELEPDNSFLLIWKTEGEIDFQTQICNGFIPKHLGIETVLALLAWKAKIKNIGLFGMNNLPSKEYIEEIDNSKNRYKIRPDHLTGNAYGNYQQNSFPCLSERKDAIAIFCRDHLFNLPVALMHWNSFAEKLSLINIVSPPYLLRDYFADNIKFFQTTPIFPLSSRFSNTDSSIAFLLLRKLISYPLTIEQISGDINIGRQRQVESNEFKHFLIEYFKETLDVNISDYILIKKQSEFLNNEFVSKIVYSLNDSVLSLPRLIFQQYISIKANTGEILRCVQYDFLFQNYLQGQIHEFEGKPYSIGHLDTLNHVLHVNHQSPPESIFYKSSLHVEIPQNSESVNGINTLRNRVEMNKYSLSLCECAYNVHTRGYFDFKRQVHLNHSASFHTLNEIPVRSYTKGRLLRLDFVNTDQKFETSMCAILSELLCTLFPEGHKYLICTSPQLSASLKPFDHFYYYYSTLTFNSVQDFTSTSSIFIFEDTHQDLGLLPVIFMHFEQILKVIDDYCLWLLEKPVAENEISDNPIHDENFISSNIDRFNFLKYGNENLPDFIDIVTLKNQLSLIIGTNSLHQNRLAFNMGLKNYLQQEETGHICDFCAAPITGSEIETLNDGRERCNLCRQDAINTIEQLKKVLEEAKGYFKTLFNVSLPKGISVEFANAEKIQELLGRTFTPTSDFDSRAIGLASGTRIYIENGAPYGPTLATTVHELTHIWQFDKLNIKRMKEQAGLQLIEGHATWAEIFVLEEKNIGLSLRNSLKNRDDDYGNGYMLILKLLKENNYQNAFKMLSDFFPK